MSAFSPVDAALEGIRVVRREPKAVAYWVAVWAVVLTLVALLRLTTGALTAPPGPADQFSPLRRLGPLALVLAPTILVLWVMTAATVYRAVLRPGEHGWHLLKLGPDEARVALLSAAESVLIALLGGVPAYLLLVLLTPAFELAPGFSPWIGVVGFVGTVTIGVWLTVRLSLIPVQTFAQRGFPIAEYWGLLRGSFWRTLLSYILVVLELLAFFAVTVGIAIAFGWLAETVIYWRDGGLARRVALWVLVPIGAVLIAAGWVAPIILTSGCQAYIYRAIAGPLPELPPEATMQAIVAELEAEVEAAPTADGRKRRVGWLSHIALGGVALTLVVFGIARRKRGEPK